MEYYSLLSSHAGLPSLLSGETARIKYGVGRRTTTSHVCVLPHSPQMVSRPRSLVSSLYTHTQAQIPSSSSSRYGNAITPPTLLLPSSRESHPSSDIVEGGKKAVSTWWLLESQTCSVQYVQYILDTIVCGMNRVSHDRKMTK